MVVDMYIFIHNMSVCVNKLDICTNIGVYIKACIHTYTHTHFRTFRVAEFETRLPLMIHTYIHTNIHYITLHTYIHTYMHMYSTNT